MNSLLAKIAGWPEDDSTPLLIYGRRLVTRSRFSRMLESARRSVESLDLIAGQCCALELRNPAQKLLAMLALADAGIVPVYSPPGAPRKFRDDLAQTLGLDAVLLSNEEDALPGIRTCQWSASDFSGSYGPFKPRKEMPGEAPALIIFTDGIEGRPRPVELDRAAVEYRMRAAASELRLDEHSRVLCAGIGPARIPIALACLLQGGLQVYEKKDPLTAMVCHGVTHAFLGTQSLSRLAEQVHSSPLELPRLERLQTWTERLTTGLVKDITKNLTENLYYGWQVAELGMISVAGAPALKRATHCRGMACEGVELAVHGADGMPIITKRRGELRVQANRGAGRYLGNGDPDGSEFQDGWLHTGMLARRGPKGMLFLEGRLSFQFDGINSRPTTGQVEQLIMRNGAALNAVALGLDSPDGESLIMVLVGSREERDRTEQLLRQKRPGAAKMKIRIVENLPTTQFGELALGKLKAQLEDEL